MHLYHCLLYYYFFAVAVFVVVNVDSNKLSTNSGVLDEPDLAVNVIDDDDDLFVTGLYCMWANVCRSHVGHVTLYMVT